MQIRQNWQLFKTDQTQIDKNPISLFDRLYGKNTMLGCIRVS